MAVILACGTCSARAQDVHVRVDPKVTVASNDVFPTIQRALDHAPNAAPSGRLYIEIAPGTYHERVWVSQWRPRTTLIGLGNDPSQVVITASETAKTAGGTFFSETVEVNGEDFQADNLTFENAAGRAGQAVAIAVNSDRAIFKHCRFLGDQDTLLANFGRQYYVDSYISGGVDFIFGDAAAVFDQSEIHITRPGYLTAQSRTASTQDTGYVIANSRITADDMGGKTFFLGRPWRAYSRVVYLKTEMPEGVDPAGWAAWPANTPDPQTPFYAEYASYGAGANPKARVPWSHQLNAAEAKRFEPDTFLAGHDHWDPVREAAKLP